MTHRFTSGRAWFEYCPRCNAIILEAHDMLIWRLSRISIPYAEACVLAKYRVVFNVHAGVNRLYVSTWYPQYGRPVRGRLYSEHICGFKE